MAKPPSKKAQTRKSPIKKLEEYERKRQFDQTPEPAPGDGTSQRDGTFVVQKHAATRLHYDFRLAIDGVLKSWAVPKGPSMNPADKRLAVQTEDHPMDYANFEGIIPKGNYGAGTVMVWDRGAFEVEGAAGASQQVASGEIKFQLEGEKLRGSFVLVKLKHSDKGNEWLMIKHKDAAIDPAWDIDAHDGSVLTGRTLDEIAEKLPPKRDPSATSPAEIEGASKAAMPSRVEPMLATLLEHPFSDPEWLYEIKWDGERALAWIADGKLILRSRKGTDITAQYPDLAGLTDAIHAKRAIVDGEIVVLDERGHSDFGRLQERMHVRAPAAALIERHPATYYAFDLLYCDVYDLRDAALKDRKEMLRRILRPDKSPEGRVRFSDHQMGKGKELFELARQEGLEGIVAKRADSRYSSSRSLSWAKIKAIRDLDAVVGGWTAPRGSREHFGSLLLGLYDRDKKLHFIGHVGTGFDSKKISEIANELKPLANAKCPFEQVPETNEQAFWTKPALVARVHYIGWTQEERLRAPAFIGLRDDKRPEDCRLENERAEGTSPPNEFESASSLDSKASRSVVRAPHIAGKVLSEAVKVEAELLSGKQETIVVELDGKRFRLTHLNKIYWPESGYTKRDLLTYYYRVADFILPFLKDRPLVLRRYPDGITGQAFFQKNLQEGMGIPDWLETISIKSEGAKDKEQVHYAIANDLASLLFLTGLGCIDHNPWSSRRDDLEHPDYFFFDLDPSEGTEFSVVIALARILQKKLEELGLKIFLKTSGATGFHIYIPVERGYSYEQLRMFGEIVSRLVSAEAPDLVTYERTVAKRPPGRVLIDVAQNSEGRPLASPYSVRAFPRAPVSAPVSPGELRPTLRPEKFNLKTIPRRLEEKGDLWADFWKSRQRIEKAMAKIPATTARPV
jgi:bifunctional non-homologous end joining protein LigD